MAGRITRVHGFTGKKVNRGDLLAEIDAVDFEIQSRADRAEIARLTSLLQQQERVVERQQKLVGQGFISQNALDDAIAQRNALREQFPVEETELVVYPTNFACPSAVLRDPNGGAHFGMSDVMSPWSGAVAEA